MSVALPVVGGRRYDMDNALFPGFYLLLEELWSNTDYVIYH